MKGHARQIRSTSLALCSAVGLCMISLRAFAGMSPPAPIEVNLTVEPIAEMRLTDPEGIVMTTVVNDWMNRTRTSQGSVGVDLLTNYSGTLRCLDNVTLEFNTLTYSVPIGIMLSGVSSAYYAGNYICLDFEPGAYTGADGVTVAASLTKLWSYGDAPGTYSGILTLEFVPR